MRIISGQNVDLLTPFPITEVSRVYGWNHCYRTFTENDDVPSEQVEFTQRMAELISICPSWGLIDKHAITNPKQEAPLIGIGVYEPGGPHHGFMHFASGRKAFKMGLLDEAGAMVVKDLFETFPGLLRVGAYTDDRNSPVKALVRRLGLKFEGLCRDMILKEGKPRNVAYFGITRKEYECPSTISCNSLSSTSAEQEVQSPAEPLQLDKDLPMQEIA